MKNLTKTAFLHTLPVMAGYLVLGAGFGILLKANGYGIFWSFLMSLLIYAGSMQYLAVGLMTGGASFLTVALTSFAVNARHLFYGISMIGKYQKIGKTKPYLIFSLTDETYSLVCQEEVPGISEKDRPKYYFLVSLFDHAYWITGSLIGSLLGFLITFDTTGIDFALTALFLTIFTDQWLKTKDHFAALTGILSSACCLFLFGSDAFLIPSMALIALVLILRGKIRKLL